MNTKTRTKDNEKIQTAQWFDLTIQLDSNYQIPTFLKPPALVMNLDILNSFNLMSLILYF